jgi:hypothetical protein
MIVSKMSLIYLILLKLRGIGEGGNEEEGRSANLSKIRQNALSALRPSDLS